MKPETVLGAKYGEEPTEKLQEWLKEYAAIAAEFPSAEDLAERLSKRAEKACAFILERGKPEPFSDDTYYIEYAKICDGENASLDGDFPLGNEADASFAGCYFSVPELAEMQCGLHHLISAGDFNGYNFDVLVRKGFFPNYTKIFRRRCAVTKAYSPVKVCRSVNTNAAAKWPTKANGVMKRRLHLWKAASGARCSRP